MLGQESVDGMWMALRHIFTELNTVFCYFKKAQVYKGISPSGNSSRTVEILIEITLVGSCAVSGFLYCQSCFHEDIFPPFLVNAEPVHSGQEGADEPPTLIKEDLLSSGAISRKTPDIQVYFFKRASRKT